MTEPIIITGRPISKKNHQEIKYRFVGKGKKKPYISQAERYLQYEEDALWQLKKYKQRFVGKVSVRALYWLPNYASWPDFSGVTQATGDILQKAEIIVNDRDIRDWDGTRIMGVDKERPRVEIYITEVEG